MDVERRFPQCTGMDERLMITMKAATVQKIKECPRCGSTSLGDQWCSGRKLQQYCAEDDCNWKGQPRIPERKRITDTKQLEVDDFYGWDYIIYDKYGHVSTISRTYGTEASATKELEKELEQGSHDVEAGPYTGVLFHTPSSITLKGKMFKIKKGVCTQINK